MTVACFYKAGRHRLGVRIQEESEFWLLAYLGFSDLNFSRFLVQIGGDADGNLAIGLTNHLTTEGFDLFNR